MVLGRNIQLLRRKYLIYKVRKKYGKLTQEEFNAAIPQFNNEIYEILKK